MLAASFGGITVFFIRRFQEEPYDLGVIANAILSGLVAITGPCAVVDAWAAGVIGGALALHFFIPLTVGEPACCSLFKVLHIRLRTYG